mmetsp:Transcript_2379/g.6128  ORF Transcript_2379/g.6128 Transcript_2379/m.6128 type:complete len:534 (-) Transcript_2379:139-1740(-)|eukprot:jgi/Tetstr1/465213/TSEL_009919.t1
MARPRRGRPAAAAGEIAGEEGGEQPAAADVPEAAVEVEAPAADAAADATVGPRMAEVMRRAARRRAAHFAHFNPETDEVAVDGRNIHTGGSEARTLGPWASARQLEQGRAEELEARKQRIIEASQAAREDVDWTPREAGGQARKRKVATLFDTTLGLLTEYVDCIESLDGIPDALRIKLAQSAAARRKLTADVGQVFVAGAPAEVVMRDLTQVDEASLGQMLQEAATPRLHRLELGMCGRGLSDQVAMSLSRTQLENVAHLELTGAYRISDDGIKALLKAMPQLRELGLRDACRLQDAVTALPEACPLLERLDLSGCRGLSPEAMASSLPLLKNLRDLSLDAVTEVDDTFLQLIAGSLPLERLSVNFCPEVTDKGLCAVARMRGQHLLELRCSDVPKLTDTTLLELAQSCPELHTLYVQRCAKLTDAGVAAVAQNGKLRSLCVAHVPDVGPLACAALTRSCTDSLESLDISWCRAVSDNMLGALADACFRLASVTAWGCSQISDRFLLGHRNDVLVEVLGPVEAPLASAPVAV